MKYYKGGDKMRSAKEQEYFPYDLKTTSISSEEKMLSA